MKEVVPIKVISKCIQFYKCTFIRTENICTSNIKHSHVNVASIIYEHSTARDLTINEVAS